MEKKRKMQMEDTEEKASQETSKGEEKERLNPANQ
jgi:hypothetical protein